MPNMTNTGTRDIPLKFACKLSRIVNSQWENGSFINKVTLITADLLHYWFSKSWTLERSKNFHDGQKQAILNTVYCHEVLKAQSAPDIYSAVSDEDTQEFIDAEFIACIQKEKFSYPKYCIKMATGTGKTWVLNALLIWQYLNAKYTAAQNNSGGKNVKYTKNFLLVAPGLIVYERLLDAFKGKQKEGGLRDFNTSDIKSNEELFVPEKYRQTIYSFVQNSVVEKHEIAKKTTGDGIIAITNWHLLAGIEKEENENTIETAGFSFSQTKEMASELLPVSPGISAGHSLDVLDGKFFNGGELEYLSNLPNICVFNDEAHHIHENITDGITSEVEWQKALNEISKGKGSNFLQIDFSATPYNVTGSGQRRTKHYFAHIIVDFDLTTAMRQGLVKSFVLDKRKEIADLANSEIEFKAIRDGKIVIGLSEGQRVMLRAGLKKLKILSDNFAKPPKMLIVCEDTQVAPFVVDFLKTEGLAEDEIMQIDSDKKGSIPQAEWAVIKQRLFSIDKYKSPKVIVSVLMLREGFDVNNVCVVVPLRSAEAPILLEQVLGRGLRLMWREPEYNDTKAENRKNLYELKTAPPSLYDILYVVEHPKFEQFYEDLDNSIVVNDKRETVDRKDILGDIITVGLKENYKEYDLFFPIITKEKEETLSDKEISLDSLKSFSHYKLEQLKAMVPKDNDAHFVSEEPQIRTRFGEYRVSGDLFTAKNYNEYLQRLLIVVTNNITKISERGYRDLPLIQIRQEALVSAIDKFIRTKLFGQIFDPLADNNWRVLMLSKAGIAEHIMKELSAAVYNMQNAVDVSEAVVVKKYFSQVSALKIRENFALDIVKSVYVKTGYPSNKGGFEKDFLLYCDADGKVERLIKISDTSHIFAKFKYVRTDGMLASYYPDFMVKIESDIYVAETKSEKDAAGDLNVLQKQKGALEWIAKINELKAQDRNNSVWHYVLIDDKTFYALKSANASITDIFNRCLLTNARIESRLDI
ncbi:MAG: DEAD/DEAH box helicase family protein [Endomicrobium sp.]|jgi:type III restriction enzyme|nr:DEAD/DEAH box helicase family protein [Endomicrobium sp.]